MKREVFLERSLPAVGDFAEKRNEGIVMLRYSAQKCAFSVENNRKEEEMNNTITDSEKPSLVLRLDEERGEKKGAPEGPLVMGREGERSSSRKRRRKSSKAREKNVRNARCRVSSKKEDHNTLRRTAVPRQRKNSTSPKAMRSKFNEILGRIGGCPATTISHARLYRKMAEPIIADPHKERRRVFEEKSRFPGEMERARATG
jgi:hypothetical protein